MPESGSPSPDSTGHGGRRLVFVVCCLVAVAAGGVLVASVGSGGIAGSPVDSILPGEDVSAGQVDTDQPLNSGGLGDVPQGLGSLRPGGATGAGGEIALDNGTFASTDTEIHFTANSSQPTYWRTAAFGTYTGTGWERTTETEPYDPPLFDDGVERVEYNVTLNQTATTLPTPWRPTAVGGIDGDVLSVREDGSVEPRSPVTNDTTFTGVSQKPPSSPALLRGTDDTTPPELERFTELPDGTAPRLAAQTGNIVSDAEGRYETAEAVKDWLREEKRYSLEAFRESDSIAETFVFEMEAGYCEYYATAMAAMLRTQDIPTRYVVGYTSGQRVDDDTYQVRGMNAHAWVEVYFEDVGWVQFDPTPGGARLERQSQALQAVGEEYNVTDPASPGEQFDLDDDQPTGGNETALSVDLNRTAVPGAAVEVTVTDGGIAVDNVLVGFGNTLVGRTAFDGTVTGRVPETDEFVISVFTYQDPLDQPTDLPSFAGGGSTLPDRLAGGVGTVTQEGDPPPDNGSDDDNARLVYNKTIDVTTDAEFEVVGNTVPGNEVGVNAFVGEDPLGGARVFVDGQQRTTTDEFGFANVVLPSQPGQTTIRVEGKLAQDQTEPVVGEQTVDLPALTIETAVGWPVTVPLAPTTVEATYGEEPAVGVPVEVDGEQVATTGADGQATVRLPFAESADIGISQYGVGDVTTIQGQFTTLLLVVGPVAVLVVTLLGLARVGALSRARAAGFVESVRNRAGVVGGLASRVLVGDTGQDSSLLAGAARRLRDAVRLVLVAAGLVEPAADTDGSDWPAGVDGSVPVAAGDEHITEERARVRAAWGRFLTHVSAPAATNTPGELAEHAIEQDGLPAEPVRTLRDGFRAVEYGSRPAEPDRIRAAVEAIEAATVTGEQPAAHQPHGGGQGRHSGGDD